MSTDFERTDWTPEEALRFYADQKNFDIVDGHARILDNGAIASNALKHHSLAHLEMKGDVELTELRAEVSRLTAESSKWQSLCQAAQQVAETAQARANRLTDELDAVRQEKVDAMLRWEHEKTKRGDAEEELAELRTQEPVAEVRINLTGGNAGIAWTAYPVFAAPLLCRGDKLYDSPVPAAQAVPDGYVLVPKEPTPEMLQAAFERIEYSIEDPWPEIGQPIYEAMLAAVKEPKS